MDDGFSNRVDGGLNESESNRPIEILPAVLNTACSKEIFDGSPRGCGSISREDVLWSKLPCSGASQIGSDAQTDIYVEGKEVQEGFLRDVRSQISAPYPSFGQGYIEQRRSQFDDALRHLPQQAPFRASRTSALGNAVVPQIPELIGRAIGQMMGAA